MYFDKLTIKSQEVLQRAQALAAKRRHQALVGEQWTSACLRRDYSEKAWADGVLH